MLLQKKKLGAYLKKSRTQSFIIIFLINQTILYKQDVYKFIYILYKIIHIRCIFLIVFAD